MTMKNEYKPYAALIASNLAKLPSNFFRDLDLSEDQLNYWFAMREITFVESIYLYTILSGLNDPLPKMMDKGIIDECERQMIILKSNFYMRLWELVHTTESHVKSAWLEAGLNYPYEDAGTYSAAWLFVNVLRDLINGKFKECLKAYFNCTVKDINLVATGALSNARSHKIKQVKIAAQKLTQDQETVIYFLQFCDYVAKKDPIVKMRLEAFNVASAELTKHVEAASNQTRDTKRSRRLRSYTWNKSALTFGSPKGGTYA